VDSFEWNKIAGWFLAAAVAVLGISIFSGILYKPAHVAKEGYHVEGVEEVAATGPAAVAEKPIAFYLASANVTKGEAGFKKCQSCHNNVKGGPNAIGPNLWGVVGRPVGKHPGFQYSSQVAGHGGNWDWESISQWIKNPKTYIPGDKMAFAGLEDPQARADIIAYLNTQADSPLPVPAAPAETAPAADAKAAAPAAVPTAEKAAPAPGKAPETRQGALSAAAIRQPSGNIGGPGAPEVTGTSKRRTR
jgi:cytochrome c